MKALIPAIGLALAGGAALAGDQPAQEEIAPDEALHASRSDNRVTGGVIDPDNREACRDRIVETYGEDADLQLRRDPARPADEAGPDNPLFYYAVDHRLGGCGVMVMTDGSKRLPPEPSQPSIFPAQ